jgi:spore maturation protein B
MSNFSNYIIPIIVITIVLHGAFKGLDVFSLFLDGARKGFGTALGIAPALIALILAINMLRSSGALNVLCSFMSPLASLLSIPKELIPQMILSPISGSGSVGIFEGILKQHKPDSYIGRCASVMMGSTETTFYTTTVYYGSVGIKKSRHTIPSALCADFTSFILSPRMVRLFFGY